MEESPKSLTPCVLDQIQEGLGLWFADESSVFSTEEYEFDVRHNFTAFVSPSLHIPLLGFDVLPDYSARHSGPSSTMGNY